jgi:hypothetical protein
MWGDEGSLEQLEKEQLLILSKIMFKIRETKKKKKLINN